MNLDIEWQYLDKLEDLVKSYKNKKTPGQDDMNI
jgi:hypothetical protein